MDARVALIVLFVMRGSRTRAPGGLALRVPHKLPASKFMASSNTCRTAGKITPATAHAFGRRTRPFIEFGNCCHHTREPFVHTPSQLTVSRGLLCHAKLDDLVALRLVSAHPATAPGSFQFFKIGGQLPGGLAHSRQRNTITRVVGRHEPCPKRHLARQDVRQQPRMVEVAGRYISIPAIQRDSQVRKVIADLIPRRIGRLRQMQGSYRRSGQGTPVMTAFPVNFSQSNSKGSLAMATMLPCPVP